MPTISAAAFDDQMQRPPAGPRGGGTGFFHGVEEFIARERMWIG